MTKDRLIAVRDPHGFRPLALGRLGDAWVVCSETCALDLIGATYVRDVEPGEMVMVNAAGAVEKPFPRPKHSQCIFEHVYFARPDSYVFGESVNEVRTELGARWRASPACRPTSSCRFPTPACAPRSATPSSPGIPMRMGPHPQSLRRPHVHRAAAVDPPLRRPREAQSGEEHPERQARGAGGRLDRARHDQPQDRADGAQRGRARGAHAHQLPADDLAVLLRGGHAAPLGAHRGHAHARGDPPKFIDADSVRI